MSTDAAAANPTGPTSLADKSAIVTGGGTGIGRAVALALAEAGAKVLIVGRREAPLHELAAQSDGAIAALQADVTGKGTARTIVEEALERFGRLDILVNNAAAAEIKPLAMLDDDEIDRLLITNIRALLALTREAVPALEESAGSVVNISSVAGQSALPGFTAYGATKAGVDRLTKVLANELGPLGIRVNAVAPGLTRTDLLGATPQPVIDKLIDEATALRRLGEPEDIARSVLWLASGEAAWVTGQIVQASGDLLLA